MYGIQNVVTIEIILTAIQKLHNRTTWNEKLFTDKLGNWYNYYLSDEEAVLNGKIPFYI